MYWLMNVARVFTFGDINGFSARLPSLLGAILALWATARLMERWRDSAAAWRAVFVLCTSYLFWWQGGWGQIDMLLCGLEMMCLWCLFTASDPGRAGRFLGAYVWAGLAMLAKGPVGLAVPLAVYVACTWATGEARTLRRSHWLWGIPIACAIPGLWLLLAWKQGAPAEYFGAMFGSKSFGRVLADHHAQPFYYYLKSFPADFLPWTLFLPAVLRGMGPGPLRRRLVVWVIVVIALFSFSVGTRHLYILLAWPGAAMLVAAGWDAIPALTRRWQMVTGGIAAGFVLLLSLAETALVAAAVSGMLRHADRVLGPNPAAPWLLLPGALLPLAGGSVLVSWLPRDGLTRRWFNVLAAVMFGHWLLAGTLVLPALNATKAPLDLAAEARVSLRPDQPIHVYRDQMAIMALYAERSGRYLRTEEEVEALVSGGDYGIIVFDDDDWEPMAERFAGRVRVRHFLMGSKDLVWVDFPPPVAAAP
jgi:4-amino-4-deoxy-L-arabinose transferase-like glycosyltransferase